MKKLTIGELRKLIQRYKDSDIVCFVAEDSFTNSGHEMEIRTGSILDEEWAGIDDGQGGITIQFNLNEKENKKPKVTYRK